MFFFGCLNTCTYVSPFLLQVMVFDTFEALNASSLSQEPGTAGFVLDTQSLYININSSLGWTPVLVSFESWHRACLLSDWISDHSGNMLQIEDSITASQ